MVTSVSDRFDRFLSNITLTADQIATGTARRESVIAKLNSKYWNSNSKTDRSKFVGSWGKYTRIRPPRDVDVLFELPKSVYDRFQSRNGNRQSQLLQEVREYLKISYPNTDIRGDGPVVLIPFASYNVELIPSFRLENGQFWVCVTSNGGCYKTADYTAEINAVSFSNVKHSDNTRDLIRMMKCWQNYCLVPLKSFWIELTAIAFLDHWTYAGKSKVYYDWMVRDYLKYLIGCKNSYVFAPGTNEAMNLGELWFSRAETALGRATNACDFEASNKFDAAGEEWQKIFGLDIPR